MGIFKKIKQWFTRLNIGFQWTPEQQEIRDTIKRLANDHRKRLTKRLSNNEVLFRKFEPISELKPVEPMETVTYRLVPVLSSEWVRARNRNRRLLSLEFRMTDSGVERYLWGNSVGPLRQEESDVS